MAGLSRMMDPGPQIAPGLHPMAVVDPTAEIGAGAAGGAIAIPIDERNLPAGQLVLVALRERVLPVAAASFAEFVGEKLAAANQNGA